MNKELNNYKENLETYEVTLEALSPIHIKGKEINYGEGLIKFSDNDDYAYLIDNDALCEWLYEKDKRCDYDLIQEYTDFFSPEKTIRDQNLLTFLKNNKIDNRNTLLSEMASLNRQESPIFKGKTFLPTKQDFITDALGKHYIPGSSIKGAIKTAIAYKMLKELKAKNSEKFNGIVNDIKLRIKKYESISNWEKRNSKKNFAKALFDCIFQDFFLISPDKLFEEHSPDGAKTDLGKIIRISDSKHVKMYSHGLEKIDQLPFYIKKRNETIIDKYKSNHNGKIYWFRNNTYFNEDSFSNSLFKNLKKEFSDIDNVKKILSKKTVTFNEKNTKKGINAEQITLHNCILVMSLSGNKTKTKHFLTDVNTFYRDTTTFRITIDKNLLEQYKKRTNLPIPFYDVNSLREILHEFAYDQWEEEIAYYNAIVNRGPDISDVRDKFYNNPDIKPVEIKNLQPKECYFRLGWGTGMLGTTVDLLFDKYVRKDLRNKVIHSEPINYPPPAPMSKRLVLKDNKPFQPLGWCKLTFV